jgi:hypothetical protein
MKIKSASHAKKFTQISAEASEKQIVKEVIIRCDERITSQMNFGETSVVVRIPVFMWSLPAYDVYSVENRVIKHYEKLGFKVVKDDLELLLDWGHPDEKKESDDSSDDSSDSSDDDSSDDDSSDDDSSDDDSSDDDSSDNDDKKEESEDSDADVVKYVQLNKTFH